jgi:hypothetical protein
VRKLKTQWSAAGGLDPRRRCTGSHVAPWRWPGRKRAAKKQTTLRALSREWIGEWAEGGAVRGEPFRAPLPQCEPNAPHTGGFYGGPSVSCGSAQLSAAALGDKPHPLGAKHALSTRTCGIFAKAALAGVAESASGECEQATAIRIRPTVRQDLAICVGVLMGSWLPLGGRVSLTLVARGGETSAAERRELRLESRRSARFNSLVGALDWSPSTG